LTVSSAALGQNPTEAATQGITLEAEVEYLASHASRFLSEIDIALTAAEEIARRKSMTTVVQHATLRTIVERVQGMRAILAINETGQLEIDSFTYPTPVLNLSGRGYYQLALSRPGELVITQPEVGKTSGVPFMPAARAYSGGVLVGVINPGQLLPPRLCTRCVAFAVDQTGHVLATNPPGSQMLGLRPDMGMDRASGRANLGSYSARYALQRAGRFNVWAILMLVD
jgi:hypothetical protein